MRYYSIGVGCDRGTSLATLQTALQKALHIVGTNTSHIQTIATIDLKSDEVGLVALVQALGLPLLCYSAKELAAVPVANPSMTVLKYVGTPSVSEAAALLGAGYRVEPNREVEAEAEAVKDVPSLVLEKYKHHGVCGKNVTLSIAEIPS